MIEWKTNESGRSYAVRRDTLPTCVELCVIPFRSTGLGVQWSVSRDGELVQVGNAPTVEKAKADAEVFARTI